MKLVIQIPCINEARTLPTTLAALPREVPGFASVEWLVVDDGSTDDTVEVARRAGVHHVVSHPVNRGLAAAFSTGITAAIALGADVIVNTDADNQYRGDDVPALVAPILAGQADMVIGARPIDTTPEFSPLKRRLQRLGSSVVRLVSRTRVVDAPCGFRAYTRAAARRLRVFSRYTYTLETIIQAGHSNLRIVSVPIRTNPPTRRSRLISSTPVYVLRSGITILRITAVYQPWVFFLSIAAAFAAVGLLAGSRFLFEWMVRGSAGHVQSVVLAASCMTLAFVSAAIGFVGDIVAVNRRRLEDLDWRLQHLTEQLTAADRAPRRGEAP